MRFDAELCVVAGVLVVMAVRSRRLAALLCVVLLGVALGGMRGSAYMARLARYDLIADQKAILVGKAVDDAGYGKQKQLTFDLTDAHVNGTGEPLVGRIGVSGFGALGIFRGDTVQVEGKLRSGLGARQGYMSFATLTVLKSKPGIVDTLRLKFAAGMQSALPEPAASFAMGLLIGQKATLPASVYRDLVMVGLVHIIAVSGYNLTIILRACLKLLGKRSKYQTLLATLTLIGVFLLITGASASIVRASIVSALSMAAWYYGRAFKPVVLILLAAAITGFANPLYIWGDIGWYLSFLAFYGVLVLAPQVRERYLRGWYKDSVIIGIGLESLCAEIMTLPLVLYIFGQMSAISLLANVMVAAFVPLAMLLSLVAGLAGMLVTSVAGWFAWPAVQLLTYMLDTAHILASVPHVFRENVFLPAYGMIAMYVLVVSINVLLYSRLKTNSAIIKALREEHHLLKPTGHERRERSNERYSAALREGV